MSKSLSATRVPDFTHVQSGPICTPRLAWVGADVIEVERPGEVDHSVCGRDLAAGNPIKMAGSPTEVARSPLLGEHTEDVLVQLGFTADDSAQLRADGAA